MMWPRNWSNVGIASAALRTTIDVFGALVSEQTLQLKGECEEKRSRSCGGDIIPGRPSAGGWVARNYFIE